MDEIYDCIVVGVGAMGSATLYQLAHQSSDCKLLGIDRFSPPHHHGSSHGGSRVIRLATAEGTAYLPLAKRSHEIVTELQNAYGHELYFPGGMIVADKNNRFLLESWRLAEQNEIPHVIYSEKDLHQEFPMFDNLQNTQAYFENSMGLLNPEAIIKLQCEQAERQGAHLHFEEAVVDIAQAEQGLIACQTNKTKYLTKKLILTAGCWNSQFLTEHYKQNLHVQRATQFYFKVEEAYQSLYQYPNFFTTLRVVDEDRVAIVFPDVTQSGTVKLAPWLFHAGKETAQEPDHIAEITQDEVTQVYNDFIKDYFKGISPECQSFSTCIYTMTPNKDYIIDYHPSFDDKVILVSACSGHGFKNSMAIGEGLAQQVLYGHNELELFKHFRNPELYS